MAVVLRPASVRLAAASDQARDAQAATRAQAVGAQAVGPLSIPPRLDDVIWRACREGCWSHTWEPSEDPETWVLVLIHPQSRRAVARARCTARRIFTPDVFLEGHLYRDGIFRLLAHAQKELVSVPWEIRREWAAKRRRRGRKRKREL